MEMKEFHYEDGLRVSVFNLDHAAVPFHHHSAVSDMVYCARGQITIELPEKGEAFSIDPGEVFQVTCPTKHRFVNSAPLGEEARYVLLQIGDFDIHFVPEEKTKEFSVPAAVRAPNQTVFIEDRKSEILSLASRFEQFKPEVLTAEEAADVVAGLRTLCDRGAAAPHSVSTQAAM